MINGVSCWTGNKSLMATNAVLVFVLRVFCCYQIFNSLKLCRFSSNFNETFYT